VQIKKIDEDSGRAVPMNGPDSPVFSLPAWTLVNESHLWSDGIPGSITYIHNPEVLAHEPGLAVFASREDAQVFLERASLHDVRPLAINDLVIFVAVLSGLVKNGLKKVLRYTPEIPGRDLWACDAGELLERLTAEAKRRRQGRKPEKPTRTRNGPL
jgi:hypothetical protein